MRLRVCERLLLLCSLLPVCHGQVGLGPNDSIVVVFNQKVVALPLPTSGASTPLGRCGARALLAFEPDIDASVSCAALWASPTSLVVTFLGGGLPRGAPQGPLGLGTAVVRVLRSAGLVGLFGSIPSNATGVLAAGSWGDAPTVSAQEATFSSVRVTVAPPGGLFDYTVSRCEQKGKGRAKGVGGGGLGRGGKFWVWCGLVWCGLVRGGAWRGCARGRLLDHRCDLWCRCPSRQVLRALECVPRCKPRCVPNVVGGR